MTFWYLGTPYSKYPDGLEAAFNLAVDTRGLLIKAGIPCFSPIIHSHPIAVRCGLDPLDHAIWLPSEAPIMAAAHGLIMVMAETWQVSKGMWHEQAAFQRSGRPIVYMTPGIIPEELQPKLVHPNAHVIV